MKIKQMAGKIKNIFTNNLFRYDDQITYMEAREIMKENSLAILLDVRSKQEYDEYHLEGAICIPTYELKNEIIKIVENKEQTIIVYCQSGGRSRKAINMLKKMGYKSLYEIRGGLDNL
ncbi:MAG: rhodanese-like domain-containing protein [Clostridia bacterium]|nr:rhodanese-like domain-containing protein [Clostridia bacterium]